MLTELFFASSPACAWCASGGRLSPFTWRLPEPHFDDVPSDSSTMRSVPSATAVADNNHEPRQPRRTHRVRPQLRTSDTLLAGSGVVAVVHQTLRLAAAETFTVAQLISPI